MELSLLTFFLDIWTQIRGISDEKRSRRNGYAVLASWTTSLLNILAVSIDHNMPTHRVPNAAANDLGCGLVQPRAYMLKTEVSWNPIQLSELSYCGQTLSQGLTQDIYIKSRHSEVEVQCSLQNMSVLHSHKIE